MTRNAGIATEFNSSAAVCRAPIFFVGPLASMCIASMPAPADGFCHFVAILKLTRENGHLPYSQDLTLVHPKETSFKPIGPYTRRGILRDAARDKNGSMTIRHST